MIRASLYIRSRSSEVAAAGAAAAGAVSSAVSLAEEPIGTPDFGMPCTKALRRCKQRSETDKQALSGDAQSLPELPDVPIFSDLIKAGQILEC